jgi:hypothetical protein
VLDSADGTVELVADRAAVLGLLLVGLALGLLGVAGDLVGGPVDVVLDRVDGGLDDAPVDVLASGTGGAWRGTKHVLALSVGVGGHGDLGVWENGGVCGW